ncbi:MAG TPA: hypothetical protein VK184_03700 [Nostocaceae cyanobacterium]|nr:hypothetical protein [Nostocaceae cyanobacterium]
MSKSYDSSYRSKSLLTTQNIILTCLGWAVLALLFFLLFSTKILINGEEKRFDWYLTGTTIFESVAFLGAGILCLRNWFSSQVVSNRLVWLFLGGGMLSYFIGGLVYTYIEQETGQSPDASVADIFFVLNYLFLGAGMIFAVISRRINLEKWQWVIVFAIGIFGSLIAWWISQQQSPEQQANQELIPFVLNWFYVVSDVLLLIIATAMLLAFWGGRVSLSWRMIAAAAFSLYIADMWYKYASPGANYQTGDILEVCWVFSGVLFGMGAALEYEASLSLKRRASGRKRT